MVNGFAIATLIMISITLFMLVMFLLIGFKKSIFFIKMRFGKVRNYGEVLIFRKGGLVETRIEKVDQEIFTRKDKDGKNIPMLGTKVLDPVHYDKTTKLPMYILFEGDFTTQDFKDLFTNNEVLKKALEAYPELREQLRKIPMDKNTLFDYVTTIDINSKRPKNKMEEILNALYIRAYNLGFNRGKQDVKASNNMNWIIVIGVVVGMVAAIVAAYYGYINNKTLLEIKSVVAEITSTTTTTGTTIIPIK